MTLLTHPPTPVPGFSTISTPRRHPSAAWYWIASAFGVVLLAGGVTFGIFTYRHAQNHVDGFARASLPGSVVVQVPSSTGRVIYYEGSSRPALADLGLIVTGPGGAAVAVRPYAGDLIYDRASQTKGYAMATFDATSAGAYQVQAGGTAVGTLVVGDNFVRWALPGILGALGISVWGVLSGLTLIIVVAVRRSDGQRPLHQRVT